MFLLFKIYYSVSITNADYITKQQSTSDGVIISVLMHTQRTKDFDYYCKKYIKINTYLD